MKLSKIIPPIILILMLAVVAIITGWLWFRAYADGNRAVAATGLASRNFVSLRKPMSQLLFLSENKEAIEAKFGVIEKGSGATGIAKASQILEGLKMTVGEPVDNNVRVEVSASGSQAEYKLIAEAISLIETTNPVANIRQLRLGLLNESMPMEIDAIYLQSALTIDVPSSPSDRLEGEAEEETKN